MVRSRSYIATPPGATIKEQLIDRGMSQKEFAARLGLSEKHICRLIKGDVQLTPDVAVKLEIVLGVPAKFWNNLESIYREKLVKVELENSMEVDETLAKLLPYNEMAKYGWVPDTRNSKERVFNLRKYFEVVDFSRLDNSLVTHIACRPLSVSQKNDFTFIAWAQEARIVARSIETNPINISALVKTIPDIRELTTANPTDFYPKLKTMLAECGIALVVLPELKGSFLQGASFFDRDRVVLGLSSKNKDVDVFWFSLFHELAHIVNGHIYQVEGTTKEDEITADLWSSNALIPNGLLVEFISSKNYSSKCICEFAKQIGVAPGIVVGKLQNDGYIAHNKLNNLKEHYEIA
ncbi:MAG: helix-turn-helix domain-containing protein [Saccharofermentans sp.]|nr:helix-turn-helix domain-containing protein [Saccharofermentans sp.]